MDLRSLGIRASQGLDPSKLQLLTCECSYYHYLCDGEDDRGWGCGYRSLQSLCSWVQNVKKTGTAATSSQVFPTPSTTETPIPSLSTAQSSSSVPSLHEIQEALVSMGDKPPSFVGSREWIGSFEVCIVLDHLYGVACKIIHVSSGTDVVHHIPTLIEHFKIIGSPVMIGGDADAASKTLVGVLADSLAENTKFLIAVAIILQHVDSVVVGSLYRDSNLDPHYCGEPDEARVLRDGYVKWHGLELFQTSSFYNFCLPQRI